MKFEKCCEIGTYEHQVPMPISGRRQDIDFCIADIVAALNAANIITVASCCGHGKIDAVISLLDGREIKIESRNTTLVASDAEIRCECPDDEAEFVPEHNICIACGKPRR